MSTERACALIRERFASPVPGEGESSFEVSATPSPEGERADLVIRQLVRGTLESITEQSISLIPNQWPFDDARYLAFLDGARAALPTLFRDASFVPIESLFRAALLRAEGLRTAADFTAALCDIEVCADALAPIEVPDMTRDYGLSPLTDRAAQRAVWLLWQDGEGLARQLAAIEPLVRELRLDTIPYFLHLLEQKLERWLECGGPVMFEDDRNVDVVLALALEPLVSKGQTPEDRQSFIRLWENGMFNPENE